MSQESSGKLPDSPTDSRFLLRHFGLHPDYRYPVDYAKTRRLRDRKTGRFVAACPFYPEHPAPCEASISAHFVCLMPQPLPPEELGRYFEATERPWSDAKARGIVFGNLAGSYFSGLPQAGGEGAPV